MAEKPNEFDAKYERVGELVSIYRRGRVWWLNYQWEGRQTRRSLKTSSKKEARLRALRIDGELLAGTFRERREVPSLTEVIESYLDQLQSEDRCDTTITKYRGIFARATELATARKVTNILGINLPFMDGYRRMRADEKAAPTTRFTELVIIRQLVNFALTRDLIGVDPLKGLRIPRPKPTPQPVWNHEQLQQILAASPPHVRPAFTVLAETGLRFGELAWLTWEDIDWGANVLRVRAKEGWRPKTAVERAVPLSPTLRGLLENIPRDYRWVVTMPPTSPHPKPGRQWTERRLLAELKKVLKRLKLPGKLHTFRHAFVTYALLRGVPLAVVQEWVGHVSPRMTRLYTDVDNSASQAAMQRLADANNPLQTDGEK